MCSQPISIFVVDDEPIIANSLARILQHHGYRAASYVSAAQALEDATADPPDLIISDVCMPGMSGIELAGKLRAQVPGCRVLLFTAHAHTVDLFRGTDVRQDEFPLLAKPVSPVVLLAHIHRMLAGPQPAHPSQRT